MEKNTDKKKSPNQPDAPDYKPYPPEEDIYRKDQEVPLENEEDPGAREGVGRTNRSDEEADPPEGRADEDFPADTRQAISTPEDDDWNTENFDTDHSGDDLDVPGSELDDDQEDIGGEDEENNYYSLGGPRKDD